MSSKVRIISRELGVSEEELVNHGLRAYLESEIRKVNAELLSLYTTYGVKSLQELDEKINRGELGETETFEDYTRVDYLKSRREKLERILGEIT